MSRWMLVGWAATAACYKPDVPDIEYVIARDALDLGMVSHEDAVLPEDRWSILNTGGVDLVVSPLRFDEAGGEMLSWGTFGDYTVVTPGTHTTIEVGLESDHRTWSSGVFSPSLVIEVGSLWNDPRDWAQDPTWSPTEITVEITFEVRCDLDGDGFDAVTCGGSDCDDTNAAVHVGVEESCDGIDNDCDGATDDQGAATWYPDVDADGFGDASAPDDVCARPTGYVAIGGDCDDEDPAIRPDAAELCVGDPVDEDCDGLVDDADPDAPQVLWYADADGDGFGDATGTTLACAQPADFVADSSDCDDAAATSWPGAPEDANGVDDDCDEWIDEDSVVPGDVVITEIMVDPALVADEGHRWFEIQNTSSARIRLDGWEIRVDDGVTRIAAFIAPDVALELPAGGILVVCEDEDLVQEAWPSVTCAYEIGTEDNGSVASIHGPPTDPTFAPRSGTDALSLRLGTSLIDEVAYNEAWPFVEGASLGVEPSAVDAEANDSAEGWCASITDLDADNQATPGLTNDSCLGAP